MKNFLSKRELVFVYLTIAVIGLSLCIRFFIMPLSSRNSQLNQEIALSTAKLKKYLTLIRNKPVLEEKLSHFAAPSNDAMPLKTDSVLHSLTEIEQCALNAAIRIIDIRPQSPRAEKLYKETLVELKTEGQLENYLKFIYSLENSLSLLRVKRLQLNARSSSQNLEGILLVSKISIE
jgi:hypothetical protein